MRYRVEGQQVIVDAGLGAFVAQRPLPYLTDFGVASSLNGAASAFGPVEGDAALGAVGQQTQCTDNPRWQRSAFDKKAWWCMCGGGQTLRRCPGCCGECPPCEPRRCQQPSYKVFATAEHQAYDCKCGPCGAAAT